MEALPADARPALSQDRRADVAVIGGGMVGMTTAFLLQRAGAGVVLLEARRIGSGVTGHSTAKLAAMHSLVYRKLRRGHGSERMVAYAQANLRGIDLVAELTRELAIDCELTRRPAITYVEDPAMRSQVEEEVEAASEAGLEVTYTEDTELPFDVAAAVRCEEQAEFHPVKFLNGLRDGFLRDGGEAYEGTRVCGVGGGDRPVVKTETGAEVVVDHVVIATHLPILDRGLYFARVSQARSYGMTCRIPGDPPRGMYLSADSPTRSLRFVPADGDDLLLVGGEGHKIGSGSELDRYAALADWAQERFGATAITHRWAAHDNMPADELPLVGALAPGTGRLHVATGMRKWGLAMGATAAEILRERCLEREHELADCFKTTRAGVRELPTWIEHNARSGTIFFGDRAKAALRDGGLAPGEGRVVRSGLGSVAVSRDDDGLHAVSARCTHLGCLVRWNDGDRTWDCPCHGSRYQPTGEVIQGPATSPLRRVEVPANVRAGGG